MSTNNRINGMMPPSLLKDEENPCSHAHENEEEELKRLDTLQRLKYATLLCALFLIVEITGGIVSGSLSVLSDAAHLFADLASFTISIMASNLASRPPSSLYTYGYKRVEALAALFSVGSLAFVSVYLLMKALVRLWDLMLRHDENLEIVDGKIMSLVALIGVIVNIALALILGDDHAHLPGIGHDHSHAHGHDHDEKINHDKNHEGHIHHDTEHAHENDGNHHNHDDDHSQSNCSHDHNHNHHDDHDHDHDHDENHHHSNEESRLLSTQDHSYHSTNGYFSDHSLEKSPSTSLSSPSNINLNAAYIHVLGDLVLSIAVVISGIIIWNKPSYQAADPLCTILFCFMVLKSTLNVVKTSIGVLMEEVPSNLNFDTIYQSISSIKGVLSVHDLHVWSISHGVVALSVHVFAGKNYGEFGSSYSDCGNEDCVNTLLKEINNVCRSKFGISHNTIQIQIVDDIDLAKCLTCKSNRGCVF